jgi:hypothetical protein
MIPTLAYRLLPSHASSSSCRASQAPQRVAGSLASFPVVHAMAHHHHLDLLLVALLYGCAFSGALFVATSLVLLVTIALAVCDARRFAGSAARVAEEAVANLRLARALAVYDVLKAAVVLVLVVRAKIGAARRIAGCSTAQLRLSCVGPIASLL